ncbi:3-hexulose-6-phosphate synthase [Salmonella enterica]|nr:3-hexulose-6-phosphate synthase [Salmonella enterica]
MTQAVTEIKRCFPQLEVLADLKIMDAGYYESEMAFKAGADYATVLGVTDILAVKGCVDIANKMGKKVVVDMICVPNMPERIRQLEEVKAHILSVHTGADQQTAGREPIEDLRVMVEHTREAGISVAGGINSKSVAKYVALNPDIIIVGSGITHNPDPAKEAAAIKAAMRKGA